MNLQHNLKQRFARLKAEEKLISFAGLITIVGCFFPWRSGTPLVALGNSSAKYSWLDTWLDSGFQGQTWLIGTLITIATIISILIALNPAWESRFIKMGIARMWVPFVLGAESLLFVIIALSVLNTKSSNEELSFGIFITLAGTAIWTLAAFWGVRHSLLRRRSTPSGDFLRFQEPESDHSGVGYKEDKPALHPEEESYEEDNEENDPQQTLNI